MSDRDPGFLGSPYPHSTRLTDCLRFAESVKVSFASVEVQVWFTGVPQRSVP